MAFYDSIKLEKGMYQTSKGNFTEVLEKIDPSENYEGTELAGFDAYQRQLKRFDIKVSGPTSDCVEKFFATYDSAVLFPEYISRAVKQGMESANILPSIVATTTNIEGMDYRSITSSASDNEKELQVVVEGSLIPETTISTQSNLVKLQKRGRMLVSSYEALRFQRLDLFTIALKQIGAHMARAQAKDAINVLVSGDGNSNAAATVSPATASTLAYGDFISLWGALAPYELNTMLASTATMKKILALSEMKDAQAGLNFQGTGKLVTPLGANLLHAPSVADNKIIGLDKNCALEMVQAGDIIVDYDKLIDRQLERACITNIYGFAKIFKDAAKILSL